MDYCVGGSVYDLMKELEKPLTEDHIAVILAGTVKGLAYLHSIGIIHRDLKSANILLKEDGQVKIADFGVSQQLASIEDTTTTPVGSPLFMSPEGNNTMQQ